MLRLIQSNLSCNLLQNPVKVTRKVIFYQIIIIVARKKVSMRTSLRDSFLNIALAILIK